MIIFFLGGASGGCSGGSNSKSGLKWNGGGLVIKESFQKHLQIRGG